VSEANPEKPELARGPDPEVSDRPKRRKFTAAYKLAILRELDACTEVGSIGAVLRREGLYSGHIANWRKAREAGVLNALAPKKRGRPRKVRNALADENVALQKQVAKLEEELRKARTIIDVQKKLSSILGIEMPASTESDG
jgi:transposase-like protein